MGVVIMAEPSLITIFDGMWIKVVSADLPFFESVGLKQGMILKVKKLKQLLKEKQPLINNLDEKIRQLILSENLEELEDDEAEKAGAIDYQQIKLSQLNATKIEKYVEINCQITGEQSKKALIKEATFECLNCGNTLTKNRTPEEMLFEELSSPKKCACAKKGKMPCIDKKYVDFATIFVRDLSDKNKEQEKFTQRNYESRQVYVIGKELPDAKMVNIYGKVAVIPKSLNISIIADNIFPIQNQIQNFIISKEDAVCYKKELTKGIKLSNQINPDIIGEKREIAKEAVISLCHSPPLIPDIEKKKIIRGGVRIVNYGDTKTGKSEVSKDITNEGHYNLGEYTCAETSGRTGITYTIDTEKGAIIWGALALNDLGLVVMDGAQTMPSEEMAQLLEALEMQKIIVHRSVKGEALARTRTIINLNPAKPMNQYLYKCKALLDTYIFKNSQSITRHDIYLPFGLKDVSSEKIAFRKTIKRPIKKEIFVNHVLWAWSRKPENIVYTDAAITSIKEQSKELIDTYCLQSLPIVHNGIRDIVTRLAVSKACELHSTDENNEKVIVETEHITLAVNFYKKVLDLNELREYKEDMEGKSKITDAEMIEIAKDLGDTEYTILNELKHECKSSIQLAGVLGLTDRSVKDYYNKLKRHGLIETKTGVGAGLSAKGIIFVRWAIKDSEIGKKDFTNKNNSERKLHHYPIGGNTPSIEEEVIEEVIHHKCSICGNSPSVLFTKQGKPVCKDCKKSLEVNK